jgi:flagellar motor switch protein FliM
MAHQHLTPDEVHSLLNDCESVRPDTIPIAPQARAESPLTSPVAQGRTSTFQTQPAGAAGGTEAPFLPAVAPVIPRTLLDQFKAEVARAANTWGDSLAQSLRTTVSLEVEDVQVCHAGLSSQYELPGCIQLLHATPLNASLYLQIDRGIVFSMVDRLLGGGKSPLPNVRRALTEIESSLLLRVTARLLQALGELFPATSPQSIATLRIESNPQCVPLQHPAHYQLRIRAAWEHCAGSMRLVLPETVLRMFTAMITAQSDNEPEVTECLPEKGVSVVAGQLQMRRDEARSLKVGDTFLITHPQVRVYVDRKRLYAGRLGTVQQHKAVKLEDKLDTEPAADT